MTRAPGLKAVSAIFIPLGSAIATHVRLGNPLFSHALFPIDMAAFFWFGLRLRNRQLRAILPFGNAPQKNRRLAG